MWADSYTITFKTGSNDGTSVSTSTKCSDLVTAGSDYLSGNLATATNVYNAGGSGLKVGTSSNSGTLKMNLSETGKVSATSIVVRAKQYNSSKATKIALNGKTAQNLSADFADYTFTLNSNITYLELVSSKGTSGGAYCWIESITVNYTNSGGGSTPTSYNVNIANNIANGSVTATPTSAEAGATVTLTATPATGYEFGSWSVTNASTSAAITVTNNKFTMPAANVNVSATFNAIQGGGNGGSQGSTYIYNKVTSQSDIVEGGTYLIVCESNNTAMSSQSTNRRNSADVVIVNNVIGLDNINTTGYPYEVTLGTNNEKFTMVTSGNKYIGNGAGSNNYLKEVTNLADGYRWTISYSGGNVIMTTDHTTARSIYVNTSNTDSYSTYEKKAETYYYVTLYKKQTAPAKTVTSIAVKTSPTTTTYFEGQNFNPAGLVITATYDDTTSEDIAYTGNEGKFTFAPTLTTTLQTSDVNVRITYGSQTCNQAITVNAKKDTSIEFSCAGNTGNGTAETPFAFTIGEDNTFPTAVVKDGASIVAGAVVTYSTTNSAYIAVNSSTGVLTLKKYASKSNNVRVTVSYAGNEEYNECQATYYLTIAKGEPVISFAEPALNVAADAVNPGQAATVDPKYGALTITYTSSNPAVADFDDPNSPILTLKRAGTATITAQSVTNDAWKQSNEVTYTLTVTRAIPQGGTTYNLVTASHPENLVDGVYVVAINDNGTYKAMTSNLNDGYVDAVTVNVSNNSITDLNGAAEWTVRVDDSGTNTTISLYNGSKYLYNYNGTFTYSSTEENYVYFIDGGFLYADTWEHWFGYADGFMLTSNYDNMPAVLLFKKTTHDLDILNLNENSTSIVEEENYYDGVVVARSLKANTWNSFCVPFAMSADDIAENFGDDAEVKSLDGLTVEGENYNLKFVDATSIEAGKPYMVRVQNAVNEIAVYDTENMIEVDTRVAGFTSGISEDMEHSVDFHGNFTKQLAPRDSYIISSNNFYFVDSDVNLKGFRGYFTIEDVSGSNKARILSFSFENVATGIEGVIVEGLDTNIYDLQGRRVMNAKNGMYLINGKKVIR